MWSAVAFVVCEDGATDFVDRAVESVDDLMELFYDSTVDAIVTEDARQSEAAAEQVTDHPVV